MSVSLPVEVHVAVEGASQHHRPCSHPELQINNTTNNANNTDDNANDKGNDNDDDDDDSNSDTDTDDDKCCPHHPG